jgi:hypothetical protein
MSSSGTITVTASRKEPPMSEHDLNLDLDITDSTRVSKRIPKSGLAAPARASLRVERCPDSSFVGRVYPLRTEQVALGRDMMNIIAINDPDVSRQHLILNWNGDHYRLHDLQSTNGTIVNGGRVVHEHSLSFGDTILIGATALKYDRP